MTKEVAIDNLMADIKYWENTSVSTEHLYMAINALEQEPKIGYWIIKDGKEKGYDIGGVKTWYAQMMCSECGFIKTAIEGHAGQYHYCPNCGARMSESKFYAKLAESYCKGLRDGLTAESEE